MQLSRRHIYAYVAVGVVVLAVGVKYLVVPQGGGTGGGEALVLAPASPSASSPPAPAPGASASSSAQGGVVVYVCGAVRAPGNVTLPADARVADALELAGGATGKAELSAVNLAAKVTDGQQILVPERGSGALAAAGAGGAASSAGAGAAAGATAAGATATGATAGAPVNINTASLEQLDTLQGVGPATAQKIIDYRTANGSFKSIDEIKNVSGIGDAKFAAMKDAITV